MDTLPSTNTPAFVLWSVEGDGKQARWTRVGAAWANSDGKGFNIRCQAIPLAGRLIMRAFSPKQDAAEPAADTAKAGKK